MDRNSGGCVRAEIDSNSDGWCKTCKAVSYILRPFFSRHGSWLDRGQPRSAPFKSSSSMCWSLFVIEKYFPDFYYAYLLTALNLSLLGDVLALWDGKKFGVLDHRSTARPGLGLGIIHFNL